MKFKFMTFFKRKRSFLAVSLVGAVVVAGVTMKNSATQKAELAVLAEGIQTCFLRVNQSFTAKLIGQNNLEYLGSNFFTTSEECFAEALGTVKNQFKTDTKNLLRNMNGLSSEVHDLHGKFRATDEKPEAIAATFSRIESFKDDTLEEITTLQESAQGTFALARQLFFIFSGLFPLLVLWEIIERRRAEARLQAVEDEALKQLQDGRLHIDNHVEAIIKRALEFGEFVHCARLFDIWKENRFVPTHRAYHELPVPTKETVVVENQIETVEELTQTPNLMGLKDVELEPLFAKVVDHLSSKIFTAGIMLDLDVAENVRVLGREETVEQLIYHSIVRSVNALSDRSGVRRLQISAKAIGHYVTLEFSDNGDAFSVEAIDAQAGLGTCAQNLELTLCRELIKEVSGQFIIENVVKNNSIAGGKIKIRLNSSSVDGKRLVSLKKGKKKDLMRELQF